MSAQIYQFPARGRATAASARDEAKPGLNGGAAQVAVTACGSAWYHEEAMQEAERKPKN